MRIFEVFKKTHTHTHGHTDGDTTGKRSRSTKNNYYLKALFSHLPSKVLLLFFVLLNHPAHSVTTTSFVFVLRRGVFILRFVLDDFDLVLVLVHSSVLAYR